MKKISRSVFFIKKILPLVWLFWFCGIFGSIVVNPSGAPAPHPELILLFPIAVGTIAYFSMKATIWKLADEVYDGGSYLLVKRGGEQEIVDFADVKNVSVTALRNPPCVTLRLRTPGGFGDEIAFAPAANGFSFNPFARNRVAEAIIDKVDQANLRRAV
jgi:hypothetical protein